MKIEGNNNIVGNGNTQTGSHSSLPPTKNVSFSRALELLKNGNLIQRAGWNGKGMFLFIRPEFSCSKETFDKIVSVPENAKKKIAETLSTRDNLFQAEEFAKFTAYISMFAADGSIVNGWLASQTDILATDWQIVE
jgi:hypothetical protein